MKKSIITSVIALTLALSACSEPKTAQQLIVSGNDFVQVGDFSSAVIEFKNAIRLEPKNANARFVLANAYLEQGSYLNAEKELSRALTLGMNFSSIAAVMARVKTRLNNAADVYLLVERSDDLTDNDYIQVLTYAGISAFNERKIAKGQDYLTQAVAIDEDAIYSQIAQAYLHYAERNFSQGLVVINKLLAQHAEISEALLIQGHLYYALQEFEHASETFALYLTYHPQDHHIRFLEVNSLIKAEKFEPANVLTDTLLKTFKDSPLALQYKAQLEYQKQNYSTARDYAEKALQHEEQLLVAKIIAGVSSYFLGDIEQAYTKLNAIIGLVPGNTLVKKVLAVTKFELGYFDEAAESFSALEGLTDADIKLLKSSSASLMSIGEFDSALALINKAEQLAPENAQLAAQKGIMLLSQNDAAGLDSIERATKLDPSLTSANIALVVEYLKTGQDSKAKEIIQNYKNSQEEAHIGYMLEGFLYLDNKQADLAIKSFEKVLELQPKNIASLYNLGLLQQDLKNPVQAISYFNQVLQLSSEHKGTLKALVRLAKNKELLTELLTVLSNYYQTNSLYLTMALAQVLRENGQVAEAISTLKATDKSVKLTANYFILLGDSYLQLKNYTQASSVFAQGLALKPDNYFLNIRYISTLEWLKDYSLALEQVRKANDIFKDNLTITASLFYFEAKNKNYQKAKSLLVILKNQKVNHHLLDTVAGEIYSVEKDYPQAIEYFSAAYEKEATEVNLLNLARTLKFNGQNKEAEHLLEFYIEKYPEDSKIRFLLAELYSNQDREKKIIQYLALSSLVPNNAAVFNNLAWNQFKLGKFAQALLNIKKAYQLKPDSLSIKESYGVILVENNDLVAGFDMLDKAIIAGSTDVEVKRSWLKVKALLSSTDNSEG